QFCYCEAENAVAQEFEPLVVLVGLGAGARTRMRQGQFEKRKILKIMANPGAELAEVRGPPLGQGSNAPPGRCGPSGLPSASARTPRSSNPRRWRRRSLAPFLRDSRTARNRPPTES